MDYFERSQQVRREILGQPELLDAARLAFTEGIEPFASGSTTHIYWLGELESGVHVAMRKFKDDVLKSVDEVTPSSDRIRHLETYCQNAEELHWMKYKVPAFCVGVVCGDVAAIFTEDLTQDGRYRVIGRSDGIPEVEVIKGRGRETVFVDIDCYFKQRPGLEVKFFSDKARINL